MNLPELTEVLDEIEFFERECTDRQVVELVILLMDETAIKQRGQQFVLFAAVDPETRHLIHAAVAPSRDCLTTRQFPSGIAELYGRGPKHVSVSTQFFCELLPVSFAHQNARVLRTQ